MLVEIPSVGPGLKRSFTALLQPSTGIDELASRARASFSIGRGLQGLGESMNIEATALGVAGLLEGLSV